MKNIIPILVLIFLILSGTTSVYSYWDDSQDIHLNEKDTFVVIEQAMSNSENNTLIPLGAIQTENDVYEIVFVYEVIVQNGYELETLIENIELSNQKYQDSKIDDLFTFTFGTKVIKNTSVSLNVFEEYNKDIKLQITISVSINNENSLEQLQLIQGEKIEFSVLLRVSKS